MNFDVFWLNRRFQTSGSGYRVIWTRRIRIWGQKYAIISIRPEKLKFNIFIEIVEKLL